MRRFSCTVAVRYRPTMACTNSCRAPALILGIVPPFVCHAPVANFVRQRDPPGNKSGDAMRGQRQLELPVEPCARRRGIPRAGGLRMVSDEQVRLMRQKRMDGKTQAAAAASAGMSERTARTWAGEALPSARTGRTWRTRVDPFAEVWEAKL